jgi:hypothetical protein
MDSSTDDVIETFDDTYGIGADDDQIKDVDTDQDFDENLNYESVPATIIEESPIDDDDDDDDDDDEEKDSVDSGVAELDTPDVEQKPSISFLSNSPVRILF